MIKRASLAAAVLLASSPVWATTWSGPPPVAILVDPDGSVYLWNTSAGAVSFEGFAILSQDKNIDVDAWKSFSEFDDGAVEAALGPGALDFEDYWLEHYAVGQKNLQGTQAILPAGAQFPLGKPFATVPPLPTDRAMVVFDRSDIFLGVRTMNIVYTPEPSTWLLATLAGTAAFAFRRHQSANRRGSCSRFRIVHEQPDLTRGSHNDG